MTTTSQAGPSYRRATLMMTATSMLVPLGGLVTAPVLAQGLGTDGRGEFAAALAPASLIVGVATLGLPEALTYFLAKRPSITRRALLWSSLATVGLGVLSVLVVWWALPFLSAGDPELARLILLATIWNVPALVVGLMRGAAVGRQMWGVVAWERIAMTVLRVGALVGLLALDRLTVETAVIVGIAMPIVSGLVYVGLLARPPRDEDQEVEDPRVVGPMFRYGSVVWLGGIATMVIARLASLLMLPLSDAEQLGLYAVATTIADVPLLVAMAIQGTLFGVSSKTTDPSRVTTTARLTLIIGAAGCVVMAGTLPLWLGPLFGEGFVDATAPTIMLLVCALIVIPGLMASSGLGAWGRPGLRSAALIVSLVVNVVAFLLLVPTYGAVGAAWAGIASTTALTAFAVVTAARVMHVPVSDFLVPRRADVVRCWTELTNVVRRVSRRA
ncbi:oligosaccharide flippase family protein [Demequina sp. SO4-13]|uniref:oligosaccharide flippase family protein n=1 Tax=Demequina sp. SO4-13 TaxID=3401027 RepID=UPI003AF77CF3